MKSHMLGLRTNIYKVSDLDTAKAWYSNAFGIEPYFDEPFYVGFNVRGFELGLQSEEENSIKSKNVLTYWGVEDIHLEYNRLIDLGATSHEEPTNVGGDLMVATVIDPWDNVIGLIYNPGFKV